MIKNTFPVQSGLNFISYKDPSYHHHLKKVSKLTRSKSHPSPVLLLLYSGPAMYQVGPWLSIVERSPDDCYFPNDNEESLGKLFGFPMNLILTCLPMLPSSPNQIRIKVNLKDNGEYYVVIISTLLT